jgi:hypothetical protein
MTNLTTDTDLYVRGAATLLASWEEYARGSAGAAVVRLDGVSAAVFPSYPERAIYNNALLVRDLGSTERAAAVDAMAAAYRSAGVERYAAWVHESDEGMRAELSARGYAIKESTRAMGTSLDDRSLPPPQVEIGPLDWAQYFGVPGKGRGARWPAQRRRPERISHPRGTARRRDGRDRDRLRPRR